MMNKNKSDSPKEGNTKTHQKTLPSSSTKEKVPTPD